MVEPKLDKFYRLMLSYAGLKADEDGKLLVKTGSEEPVLSSDERVYYLPYRKHLKTPDGKKFFHVLNENHEKPEAEAFSIYKDNLLLEINSKLAFLMSTLIDIASQPDLQKTINSRELIDLLTKVGEVEPEMSTILMEKVLPRATRDNGSGAFVDFFIRKDGIIDGIDYRVIGKTNFILYKELTNALEEREYKIFGLTVRKKDILAYINVLDAIFPNITDEVQYSAGTDNVVFGFLNALFQVSYIVSDRINYVLDTIIKDIGGETLEEIKMDLEWSDMLEEIYDLTDMIRYIPNQDDIAHESTRKLKVNESKVKNAPVQKPQEPQQPYQPPTFNRESYNRAVQDTTYANQQPGQSPPQFQPQQPQTQQPQQPQQQGHRPSLEEAIAGMSRGGFGMSQPPMSPYQQPQQFIPQGVPGGFGPAPMPAWLQQQMMQQQQQQQQQQFQMYPQQQQYGMMGGQPMGYQGQPQQNYMSPYQQPQGWNQQYGYNQWGQPVQQMRRDAFSHIEPSSLNSGG